MTNEKRHRLDGRGMPRTAWKQALGPVMALVLLVALGVGWPGAAAAGTIGGKGQGSEGVQTESEIVADQNVSSEMLRFVATGKVRIEVHDPQGRVVSRETNEIDGAIFQDVNSEMTIEIPQRVVGDYLLHLYADGSANRIHTFNVSVTDGLTTIPLAEKVLIMNAPHEPYIIRVTQDGFTYVSDVAGTAPEDSDVGSDEQGDDGSSSLIWIIVGAVLVIAAAVAGFLILRSRKHKA